MINQQKTPPDRLPLGKAKAMEVVVLGGAVRLIKKEKVRYWIERKGAREDYYVMHRDVVYHMTSQEFKRRFKVIIKPGVVRLEPDAVDSDSEE